MIHHVTRATRHLVFWTLVIVAIALSSVRLVLLGIDRYKDSLEDRISGLVGAPVRVKDIGTKMRLFSPELVLNDVDIDVAPSTGKPAIHLDEIRFGIDLGEFLMKQDMLSASWITLVGARLLVYRTNTGSFAIQGLDAGEGQPLWLLQGRHYKLLQSQIKFNDFYKDTEPFKLDDVNIAIMNEGDHHRIHLITPLPKPLGDHLKVIVDLQGSADRLNQVEGKAFFEGSRVSLPKQLADFLPSGIHVNSGTTDFKIWSDWRQAKPINIKGDIQVHQTELSAPNRPNFSLRKLDTQFHWQTKNNQWQLDINRFLLESFIGNNQSVKKWPDLIFKVVNENTKETGSQKIKLFAEQADLSELSIFANLFAPLSDLQVKQLDQSKIKGILKDFALYAEPSFRSFALRGRFDSVGMEPLTLDSGVSVPGLSHLSGRLKGSEKQGQIEFDSRNANLTATELFEKSLLFSRFEGVLDWRQTESDWVLSSESLTLDCPAFTAESRLQINFPKANEKPFVDVQLALNSQNMQGIANYLPTKIMTEKLKSWLKDAFIKGNIPKGELLFYGNLADFPFKNNSGVFEANFDLDDVELNFNPSWPHISGIHGQLNYDQSTLKGLFDKGNIGPVNVTQTEMSIADLGSNQEQLVIKGEALGEINDVLSVLQQSPIAERVTSFVAGTSISGSTKGALELTVPLWPGRDIKLDGNAQFNNAEMSINKLGLKVKKIVGALKFDMKGIYSDAIQAVTLGYPASINVSQTDDETLINVDGKTRVRDIENLFNWPKSNFAQGEGAYQLQLHLPKTKIDKNTVSVEIKSTLEGFELALPGTLAKTGSQKKPSTLTLMFENESAMPVELNYNNELKAAVNLDTIQHKINSGHILIGTGSAVQRRVPGIKFEINKGQLPLQDWLVLAGNQGQDAGSGFNVNEIKIQSESAYWKKTRLGAFDLTLSRKPEAWAGETESSIAKGKFQIPLTLHGSNPIVMDMEMLNLSALKQFKLQSTQSANAVLKPLLNLHSKKNLWQSANLGQMTLVTGRTPQGIVIKRLELDGADEKLVATGDWKDNGIISSTQLKGKLDIKKADQFFDKLNITKDLTDTKGTIEFNLNWRGGPWQLSLPDLRGQMDVNLQKGRILSIEPGFGRLLGILAVEQWLRRIQFDFSDIYQEGLTFNSIKGHFELMNGKAVTNNLTIDAIPATITISGETDLTKQTVNHIIKVVPKSSDAVPIAGTIVGEFAALVGKSLTGKNQEGFFFGTQYEVKGNWDDAKISSLHENDGLFQKTWNSITDFSWLLQDSEKHKK
ncbi:MAG: TIGR02099 family protein [Methylococcaceae bacterium]|nr:TIGR02099 family protein [Methylococcaceae bacterium]